MNAPRFPWLTAAWNRSTLCRACMLMALAIVVGCAGGTFSGLELSNPFRRQASVDESRYGPTASDRIDELRELADRASEMPANQQHAVAEQLASRLRSQSDPILRCELVHALSAFATPSAASGLYAAMEDEDPDVRIAACTAWQRVGGPEAADVLVAALRSETNVDVRLAAARAMSSLQDLAVLRALAETLDDPDPALKRRARISLARATGQNFGNNDTAWRDFVHRRPDPVGPLAPNGPQAVAGQPSDIPPFR